MKVNFHPMKSKKSSLVLSSKKLKKATSSSSTALTKLARWKTFSTYGRKKRGSDSNVELYASEEEEEGDKSSEESAAEESQPNALQWSS